jgi:hypothetical protein
MMEMVERMHVAVRISGTATAIPKRRMAENVSMSAAFNGKAPNAAYEVMDDMSVVGP